VTRQHAQQQDYAPSRRRRGRGTAAGTRGEEGHRLLELQRAAGNAAVARAIAVSRAPAKEPELTGIGANFAVDQYAGVAQKLRENWARLTPYGRAQMLVSAVNFELSHVDVPDVSFELTDKLEPRTYGRFHEQDWALQLNRARFADPSSDSIDQAAEGDPGLAQVVYHEARHAEQYFRIARVKAGMKWKANTISDSFGMPERVTKEAARHPLKGDGPEVQEAESWEASIYGGRAEESAKIEKRTGEIQKQLFKARADQEKLEQDPRASEADKKRSSDLVDRLEKQFDEARAKYLQLPEEADAWKVGGRMESALGKAKH